MTNSITPDDIASLSQQTKSTLDLKRVAIDTYKENVAYMHRNCSVYCAEGFQALSKIVIEYDGRRVMAVLNVVDDNAIVTETELGLSEQAFEQFGIAEQSKVSVVQAERPHSMDFVRQKLIGERLSEKQFTEIATDIVANRYSKVEITAFLLACSQAGLDRDEVYYLCKAMVTTGEQLQWSARDNHEMIVDKHCIGGIPGNRSSMIVVPIVAAYGLYCPKTSSRAITSPAGTADTMEVLANVEIAPERMRDVLQKEHGCIAWGGTAKLAPVDDILISVERPLELDSVGQMVASILSKKIAAGSTHLLLDVPVGLSAKVRHRQQGVRLRKLFEYVGDHLGIHLEVLFTDGNQPIGMGIGPVLEARDVMKVLANEAGAPKDLRNKALQLAGRMIEFDPEVRGGDGLRIATEILQSGAAREKMQNIIKAQGEQTRKYSLGRKEHVVEATAKGEVKAIDNLRMARIARRAGAPLDKGSGVELYKKVGDKVKKGEPLYRIYAEFEADYQYAVATANNNNGYTIV
jgi:thymidine phosphorylase